MKYNYERYYKDVAKLDITSDKKEEMQAHCTFHKDETASLSINKKTGTWFCHGGCGGGGVLQFHIKKFNLDPLKAEKDLEVALGMYQTIPEAVIDKAHELLLRSKKMLQFLTEKRGLTLDTINKYKLGCDVERVYIPIRDADSLLVNIRKYLPDFLRKKTSLKMMSWKEGFGDARLFPIANLTAQEIVLCEGEADCLLCNQLGYNAVTVTSGANTWRDEFVPLFKGKTVYICYDRDTAGNEGSIAIAEQLKRVCKEVRIITLPFKLLPKHGEDFTDYIVNYGHTKADFDKLIQEASPIALLKVETPEDNTVYKVPLNLAGQKEYYYKNIEMNIIVSGKDLAPYFCPTKVQLTCDLGQKSCKNCPLGLNAGVLDVEFKLTNQEMLQLINCTDFQQRRIIKAKAQIHNACEAWKLIPKEVVNVEEVRVIPELDHSSKDTEYITRQVFYIGYGIQTNRSYKMVGVTLPDPNTQYVTQIITKSVPTQTSIDLFKMTPELYESLKVFQPVTGQALSEKLTHIADDLSYNVTHIYDRPNIIIAIDLIYHSVLHFKFQGNEIRKGLVEGLLVGDTRTGKTETGSKLIKHYKLGELCTSENISYAGLIGGMSKNQERWSISWGKIPLNDRRLILLDEVSSLDAEMISNMSGLRSSGIAEVIKIQTERTNARTRLIWMSNPRSGRKLDTYTYGILSVKELIGRVEDIARFDFAITVSSSEVDTKVINALNRKTVPHIYTSELCNSLLLFAWSRTSDQVEFSFEAEKLILEKAQIMGQKYSPQIPLVEASEQRIKLARLSVALAARVFSVDKTGEKIIVLPKHVQCIYDFLEKEYSRPSMGYDLFSAAYRQASTLTEDKRKRLEIEFKQFPDWQELRELLLEYTIFRKGEILDQMGFEIEIGRKFFKWASRNHLIKTTPIGFVKTAVFNILLKNIKVPIEKEEVING